MKEYYVYAYLDPRKKGNYCYGDMCFLYEPFYVGKGKKKRMFVHMNPHNLKRTNAKSNKINKILREYGNSPYIIKIQDSMTENDAFDFEKTCVKIIGKKSEKIGPLLNQLDGGYGSFSGKISPNWNHKHSEETKEKLRTARKNQKIDDKYRISLSKSMKGKKKSKEHCLNISNGKKGIATVFHTDETKKKISNAERGVNHHTAKEYIFIKPTGERLVIYSNFDKFVIEHNLTRMVVKKYINKGKIPPPPPKANNLTNTRRNTTGWEIFCPSMITSID